MLLGEDTDVVVTDIEVKQYVKFLLKEGTIQEKREVMSYLNTPVLFLSDRVCI